VLLAGWLAASSGDGSWCAVQVEYVLFAKTRGGLVYEVVEIMDSHASNEQHAGNAVGVAPKL